MSSASSSSGLFTDSISAKAGLVYGIAIALGILVLVSTIMLASYVCVRLHGRAAQAVNRSQNGMTDRASDDPRDWSRQGLDDATLESYPKFVYSEKNPLPSAKDASCSICLADYKEYDALRLLPDCRHIFHANCVDSWLRLHVSCPMCRASPLPTPKSTPGSTPLSELIPLARNPLSIRYTIHHNI